MIYKPTILAVAGSLRRDSYNKRVLRTAVQGAENAGGRVTLIDLNDFPMPLYNADDHERFGYHEQALRLQQLINQHDGLLIATPAYNGSLPAVLKNAIDWASRPNETFQKSDIFPGKMAAIMSASPGSLGGVRALGHLRDVLTSVKVQVLPAEIAVTFVEDRFNGRNLEMIDEDMKQSLFNLGRLLVDMLRRTHPASQENYYHSPLPLQPQRVI